jgi:flavin reductase (DIM6/NTAB) family NADH-FMN oxidoreductase RutF
MSHKIIRSENLNDMPKRYRTQLINSLSGFKSANLLGTISEAGAENLAIFSSAVHLGANPSLIGLISRPFTAEVVRHSLRNIRETGYFTLSHVHEGIYQEAHHSSARYADGVSEFEQTGLTAEYLEGFKAPFVKEARLKIGLEFKEEKFIELNNTYLVIGEVQVIVLPEDCLFEDGMIDLEKAGTITVSGLDSYHRTERIERLPYAKPKQ